jgi:hypothetical protein
MLRVFLANFIVEILPLLMIAAAIILVLKAQKDGPGSRFKRYVGISLAAIPGGIIVYMFAGIAASVVRGEGHFYSVPFGAYTVSNNAALVMSILFWIGLVFLALMFVLRPRQ